MYLRGMIDRYNCKRKRILSKRRDNEKKEAKENVVEIGVGNIFLMIKEAAMKKLKDVTNKWKKIFLEKEKIIQKELEEEINGRREEWE